MSRRRFLVVGGGLGGALMAVYLGKAGHKVEVYERRRDPRRSGRAEGRSINLAISTRGLTALRDVGLSEAVLQVAVPMRGRMIHGSDGRLTFQAYDADERRAIHSVSRAELNRVVLEAAERMPGVAVTFGKRAIGIDLDEARVELEDVESGRRELVAGDAIVGADGAWSAIRREMQKLDRFDYEQSYLGHAYKELSIPAGEGGAFRMEPNALHIWPRGGFMMIALPNLDGSYTCTCFWPWEGENGFAPLRTPADVSERFRRLFPDALALMPTLHEDFFRNPTAPLVTIRCRPWSHRGRVVLLGDACHAVVPFYGQGANAAFEDCTALAASLSEHPDLAAAFADYEGRRKENTDALADLALDNFIEMRDKTASRLFHLGKRVEHALHRALPRWYLPLYSMISFSTIPYARARRRAMLQDRVVRFAALACALLALAALLAAVRGR